MNPTQLPPKDCPKCKSTNVLAHMRRQTRNPFKWQVDRYVCLDCGEVQIPRQKTDEEYAQWRAGRIQRLAQRYARKGPQWEDPDTALRVDFLRQSYMRGGIMVEIGVRYGIFSQQILNHLQPSDLHLIDPWIHDGSDPHAQREEILEAQYQSVCLRFYGVPQVSIRRKKSAQAVEEFDDESLRFVYIDGNHLYEFVLLDCLLWWPKVQSGGVLAGHDYRKSGKFCEVKQAVDHFGRLIRQRPRVPIRSGTDWYFEKG